MSKKLIVILLLFLSTLSYGQHTGGDQQLLKRLQILSADSMEGRGFGSAGSARAQKFIAGEFKNIGLKPAFNDDYFQSFIHPRYDTETAGKNIVAVIPGRTNKIIVITAHYDHLGIKDTVIFNGADDNASGTAALLSIGEYFKNKKPEHTLVLAAVDAEETGSIGAQYLLDNFPYNASDIVLNVNMDMIAHNDSNELYACGTYFYPHLKDPLSKINSSIDLKFGHDSPEFEGSDNWTYSSDHRVFHRRKISFIYFGVEDHEDYHKSSDIFERINHKFYLAAVELIIKSIELFDKKYR